MNRLKSFWEKRKKSILTINPRSAVTWRRRLAPLSCRPSRTLEELRQAAAMPKKGYDVHHVAEKKSAEKDRFPTSMIDGPDNLVRIPRFKHWEITSWYMTKNDAFGDVPPREYLRGKDWAERTRIGLRALIQHGVLNP